MTTTSNLAKLGNATTGVSYSTGVFSFNIAAMNAVIVSYNTANSTNYATWDTIADNYEKLIHFISIYTKIQNLILGNDTFNVKWYSTNPLTLSYGTRGNLNSKVISLAYPFTSASDIDGDSDSLG
jgi:hypothetical protein